MIKSNRYIDDFRRISCFSGTDKLRYLNLGVRHKWIEVYELFYQQFKNTYFNGNIEDLLKKWYKYRLNGCNLNLENPINYSEKIQWLKLYDATPQKTLLSDKVAVKDWVAKKIGPEHVTKIIKIFDSVEDIDFDNLPNEYIIKTNNSSGCTMHYDGESFWLYNKIHDPLNNEQAKNLLNWYLKHNYAFVGGFEMQYLNIKPKIIIEEFDKSHIINNRFSSFHYFCFAGKPLFTRCFYADKPHVLTFSIEWEKQDWDIKYEGNNRCDNQPPIKHEEMIEYAKELSQDFAFVRVDFRNWEDKIMFEEFTFSPASGIYKMPDDYFNRELGDLITLPTKREIPKYYEKEQYK